MEMKGFHHAGKLKLRNIDVIRVPHSVFCQLPPLFQFLRHIFAWLHIFILHNRCCIIPCKPKEEGLLILENVKKRPNRSYRMFPKTKPVPLSHVELIIKKLAQFHGLWLQYRYLNISGKLKSQNPNADIISWSSFQRRFMVQKKVPKVMYKSLKSVAKKSIIRILKKQGQEESENIQKCRTFFDRTANDALDKMFEQSPSPEIHTLCHGDFWSNNIMFHYANEKDEFNSKVQSEPEKCTPTDLILIDFQLINYSNPCYDLVYFLYINTDLQFRDNHLNDILKMYYNEFSQYFPTDIEDGGDVQKLKNYTFEKVSFLLLNKNNKGYYIFRANLLQLL
jgi:hypothetical protein